MIEQTENRLSVAEAQNICLRNNIPFYTYRLPGSREVIFGAQLSNDTRIFKGFEKHRGEKGFVITPFNHSSWSFPFFIKADLSFTDYLSEPSRFPAIHSGYRQQSSNKWNNTTTPSCSLPLFRVNALGWEPHRKLSSNTTETDSSPWH